jgi:BirA family biotin operon repressor/biotin-[acetyl-CoA-carboxylase] ligase
MAVDLNNEKLRAALGARPFRYYAQIGSTNDTALAWLRDGGVSGAVVIADYQTQGRGRLGRRWVAPPGTALMASVLLHPPSRHLARVNMIAALSVDDTLREFGVPNVTLKWPNDVLLQGRKVCGILSESAWDGSKFLGAALGIGINVSVDFDGTPLASSAISLVEVIGDLSRIDLLSRLLHHLDGWMGQIATEAPRTAWRRRLATIGQRVSIALPGENLIGVAEDVDEYGALLVRRADGSLGRALAGDIAGLNREQP